MADVVSETSKRLSDPGYGQVAVGTFVQQHPQVGQYLSARMADLGGGENVIHAAFHAQVMAECIERHRGSPVPPVGFRDLDAAAKGDPPARLREDEPALSDYLASNVDEAGMRSVLALVALALRAAAAR